MSPRAGKCYSCLVPRLNNPPISQLTRLRRPASRLRNCALGRIRTQYPDKPMLENPTTQTLVHITQHTLRQTPHSLESFAKLGPVRRDSPMQHRLLGPMRLVLVFLCVLCMTVGCKHARELCAHRAKRFSSCFPNGFTSRSLAAAMAGPGGRHLAARCSFLCAPTRASVSRTQEIRQWHYSLSRTNSFDGESSP